MSDTISGLSCSQDWIQSSISLLSVDCNSSLSREINIFSKYEVRVSYTAVQSRSDGEGGHIGSLHTPQKNPLIFLLSFLKY